MTTRRFWLVTFFILFAVRSWAQCRVPQPEIFTNAQTFALSGEAVTGSSPTFSVRDRGAQTFDTEGNANREAGYARIQPNSGSSAPSAYLTFQFRQNNVLVGQASVPATKPTQGGRIYAEVADAVNTGIAIANPNSTPAAISFYFTDAAGNNFSNGSFTLNPNSQIARFLNDAPFSGKGTIRGTLTFTSSVPVAVIALRGYTNERSEFLMTTLPVSGLSASGSGTLLMPHFADGGGWRTQVVLVNPTDQPMSGSVQFMSKGSGSTPASPLTMTVDGRTASSFSYSIPPRASVNLGTSGSGGATASGSVRVIPAGGSNAPTGLSIFSFRNNGVTVSEAGVPAVAGSTAFRLYDFECGDYPGQIRTGVAITNPSTASANVNIELTDLNGSATGMSATVTIPPGGQIAKFLKELIPSIPYPFHGVARITSSAGIAVVALRGDYNTRGDFLITTATPTDENSPATSSELIFPHLVAGGGYMTEFVVYSGVAGQSSAGVLRFFTQDGRAMSLTLN